jgi:hypothetical protein
MSHNPKGAGQASNQATDVEQVNAGRSTQRGQIGGNAPSMRGNCFFESRTKQNNRHQHCQLVPDQPRKDSQLFFGCWQARLLGGRRSPVYPQGKEREIPSRKSATQERRRDISCTAGPDEGGARRGGADA